MKVSRASALEYAIEKNLYFVSTIFIQRSLKKEPIACGMKKYNRRVQKVLAIFLRNFEI